MVRPSPPAPRPAQARVASGQLIALHDISYAEQIDFEKRLRRLEEIEECMGNLPLRNIELEDAYDILKIEIEEEYSSFQTRST